MGGEGPAVLSPQLSRLWIWILPMFGEPGANSLILGCWEAQWDGWLFNSSACSHKDMFDFHPYGDVWFLILNKKDLLWVNVSLSYREATDSQSLLLTLLWILPSGLCVRLEEGILVGFQTSILRHTTCVAIFHHLFILYTTHLTYQARDVTLDNI